MSFTKMGYGALTFAILGAVGWQVVTGWGETDPGSKPRRSSVSEPQAPSPAITSEIHQLQNQLSRVTQDSARTNQALLAEIQKLEARLETKNEPPPLEASSEPPAPETSEPQEEDSLLRLQKIDEDAASRVERIDEALYNEPRDEAWADPAEAQLSDAFQDLALPDSRLLETTCGSTFCRMEVMHGTEEGSQQLEAIVEHVGRMNYYLQNFRQEDGQHQTLAYFIRQDADGPEHAIRRLWH